MELTKEQIQNLYTFTKKHFVEYYDVQTELVDHLANNIEQIWKDQPNLSFIEARNLSFKKFGIYGFSEIVEQKQKELNKHYWKLSWKYFKAFFTFPKIMLTLFLMSLTYLIIEFIPYKNMFVGFCISLWTFLPLVIVIYRSIKLKKRRNATGKKWLFENIALSLGGYAYSSQFIIHFYGIKNTFDFNSITTVLFAILIPSISILLFILVKIIPKKLEENIAKQHPEYNLYEKA